MGNKVRMIPGRCYEVIRPDSSIIKFRLIGGSPAEVELPDGEKALLDVVMATFLEWKEIPCKGFK